MLYDKSMAKLVQYPAGKTGSFVQSSGVMSIGMERSGVVYI